jgi:hypothetical protein
LFPPAAFLPAAGSGGEDRLRHLLAVRQALRVPSRNRTLHPGTEAVDRLVSQVVGSEHALRQGVTSLLANVELAITQELLRGVRDENLLVVSDFQGDLRVHDVDQPGGGSARFLLGRWSSLPPDHPARRLIKAPECYKSAGEACLILGLIVRSGTRLVEEPGFKFRTEGGDPQVVGPDGVQRPALPFRHEVHAMDLPWASETQIPPGLAFDLQESLRMTRD